MAAEPIKREAAEAVVDEMLGERLRELLAVEVERATLRQELAASEAACASAMAEVEALKTDRAWEAKRANEAARLSAEARDQADDLRRQIEALNEHVSIVEGDRTDNDRWAVNLVVEFDLDPPAKLDPYDAIARGLREWRQRTEQQSEQIRLNGEQIHRLQLELAQARDDRDKEQRLRAEAQSVLDQALRAGDRQTTVEAWIQRDEAIAQRDRLRTAARHVVDCYRHADLMATVVAVDRLGEVLDGGT